MGEVSFLYNGKDKNHRNKDLARRYGRVWGRSWDVKVIINIFIVLILLLITLIYYNIFRMIIVQNITDFIDNVTYTN